jgi:hypothetical protein
VTDKVDNIFVSTGMFIYDTIPPEITIAPYITGRTNEDIMVTASTNE